MKKKLTKLDGSRWFKVKPDHKLVLKEYVTKRSHCADKKCKFYGQLAEQGVCYHRVSTAESRYFDKLFQTAEHVLAFNRKHNYKKLSNRQLIKRLEGEVVCNFMNARSCLDELVWLRGENAKLRGKLGIFRK